jgi:diacylglycerol kinase (ATP)
MAPSEPSQRPSPRRRLPRVRLGRDAKGLPKQGTIRWSFTWAFEGIVYVLRTQRNMQLHLGVGLVSLIMALVLDLSRLEILAVVGAVSFVIVVEMLNTAIEAAVDAVISEFHPLAKTAKDVAAGAVLVAAVNAAIVAYLVFYNRLTEPSRDLLTGVRRSPTHLVVIALVVTVILAIAIKAASGSGTPLRGGFPSAHAATAFAAWVAVTFITEPLTHAPIVSTLAFLMALLVAQSRVEAGIHSAFEVVAGAVLGTAVTVVMFQLWG